MVFALVVVTGVLLVGLYLLLKYDDAKAAAASAALAAAVFALWFSGTRERDRLAEELRQSDERIAELEAAPAQRLSLIHI